MSHRLNGTSVDDAKGSLICTLERDPASTAREALEALVDLQGKEGHASRRKMLATILRKATKLLEGGAHGTA